MQPNETFEYFGDNEGIEELKKSKAKVVVRVLKTHIPYRLRHNGDGLREESAKLVEDNMQESSFVRESAKKVVDFVTEGGKRNMTIIKVRRGDKLQEAYRCLDECTKAENILQVLEENRVDKDGSSIYILSNEKDPKFFDPLRERGYRVMTMKDIPLFKEKEFARDNYIIFAVELSMAKLAKGMIGTFIRGIRYWGQLHPEAVTFREKLSKFDKKCLDVENEKTLSECQTECAKCQLRYERETDEERAAREAKEKANRKW